MSIGSWSRQTTVGNKSRKMFMVWGVLALLTIIGSGYLVFEKVYKEKLNSVNSFQECVAAGNPVLESFPEQCVVNGLSFTNPDPASREPAPKEAEIGSFSSCVAAGNGVADGIPARCTANGVTYTDTK